MTDGRPATQSPGCCDERDPGALSVDAALRRMTEVAVPVGGHEQVAIRSALGRVLAETLTSPVDVPAHTNSAMDGYALRAADLPGSGQVGLRVIGTALAGAPFAGSVEPGTAVRIMTGAVLPRGADCVVMQERVEVQGERACIGGDHRVGENIRRAGEDLPRGSTVLEAGRRLLPADLGLLASLGVAEVRVWRRVRVAFFSTGDELRSIGETLARGEIHDSNRYTLHGMLRRLGTDIVDMGVVRDRPEALRQALVEASRAADAVITSGGVSVGEADYVKDTLGALGTVDFWKIAMKPGRPLAFGRVGDAVFFGLPGNPVSVMVTFYQFVQPALRRMMGEQGVEPVVLRVPCLTRLKKRPGRTEYQRGILGREADGSLVVRGIGEQGSGILSSVSRADCFIILSEECAGVAPGERVAVQPFHGLV